MAITATNILGCEHASGSVSGVQIGNSLGIDTNLCTAFVSDGVCGGSVQNCTWGHQYNNSTNDTFLFLTCRPVTNGITYIVTNPPVGLAVVWYSIARLQWFTGTVTFHDSPTDYTFPDGMHAVGGLITFNGTIAIGGDSGSPVFNTVGDLVGVVTGTAGPDTAANYLWPDAARTRPTTNGNSGVAGLGALFNSDPDL
jgi:hypothetical protein